MKLLRLMVKGCLLLAGLMLLNYIHIWLYGQYKFAEPDDYKQIKYVLIPGAGRNYPESPNPNYAFLGRMKAAVVIHREHPEIPLILSGYADGGHYREANDMLEALVKLGIDSSSCILDSGSIDTYASIDYYTRNYKNSPVLIVSQTPHLERALWLACALGADAYGYEAEGYPQGTPRWLMIREFGARIKARLEVWGILKHHSEKENA